MPEDIKKRLLAVFKAAKVCPFCKHGVYTEHRTDNDGNIWCFGDKWKCDCKGK
jgi:hypothetical protein